MKVEGDSEELHKRKFKKKHKSKDSGEDAVDAQIKTEESSRQTEKTEHKIKTSKKKKRKINHVSGKDAEEAQNKVKEETGHEIKTSKKKKRKKMDSDKISEFILINDSEDDFTEQSSPKKKKHKKRNDESIPVQQISHEISFCQNEGVDLENNYSSNKKRKKSSSDIESKIVNVSDWNENTLIELLPSKTKKKRHKNQNYTNFEPVPDIILQAIDEITTGIESSSSMENRKTLKNNNLTEQPFPKEKEKNHIKRNEESDEEQINSEENLCNLIDQASTIKKTRTYKNKNGENDSEEAAHVLEEKPSTYQEENSSKTRRRLRKLAKNVESESDNDDYKNIAPDYLTNEHIKKLRRRKKMLQEEDASSDEDESQMIENLTIDINWEIPPLHQVTGLVWNKNIEQECNQTLKKGAWSIDDDLTLINNWREFKEKFKIRNPMKFLGLKKGFKIERDLQLDFVRYLGRGLNNRNLISIYQQARRMFDPHNYKGRMSETEYKIVRRLVVKYGHSWEKIGRKMNRTGESVRYAWKKMENSDKQQGRWTEEESEDLIKALKEVTGCQNLENLGVCNLPWQKVSEIVKIRSERQCRLHWIHKLCMRYNKRNVEQWTAYHKVQLLEFLNESNYMSESDISWEELATKFGLPHGIIMRSKWCTIKSKAPQYYVKPFRENLDWLLENYLPKLRTEDFLSI